MSDSIQDSPTASQEGNAGDYFAFIGFPHRLSIDERELQERYFALSRQFHPDFHIQDDDTTRQYNLERSSILNQAYRTLRDPFDRARHLLSLEWPEMPDQEKKAIPPQLLMEVMEMQETVSELHAATDPARRAALGASLGEVEKRLKESMSSLRLNLDRLGASLDELTDAEERRQSLRSLNTLLNTRNYLRTLLATIDAEIHGGAGIQH